MSEAAEKVEQPCAGHRQRLRERYARGSLSSLSDYEFIELVLTFFIPRVDVKSIAKELLKKYKNLRGILEASDDEIRSVKGLGETSVVGIRMLTDAITTYHMNELEVAGDEIATVSKLIRYFKSKIGRLPFEALEMVCFDSQLRILPDGAMRLFEGSVNSANVDIRKIIEMAIKRGASSIAISHNHPSGDPHPSFEDIRLTRKLSNACRPINLSLIEHVIVGKNACFSFRRDGMFDELYDNNIDEGRLRGKIGAKVAEKKKKIKAS